MHLLSLALPRHAIGQAVPFAPNPFRVRETFARAAVIGALIMALAFRKGVIVEKYGYWEKFLK